MSVSNPATQPTETDAKRTARLEAMRQDAPRCFATFRRAYGGQSLRAAVNAMCVECCGFDAAAVRDCTALACHLYSQRPGRK